jgi:diketogulonate reductase-like aldo/keto reductase
LQYETVHNLTLPKIGFGTWRIGGKSFPNPKADSVSLASLRSALELGYTHFDTAEMYASGHAEDLIGQTIRETHTKRESLFITSKVMPSHLKYDQVLHSCEASLKRLKTGYIDLYLIHWPGVDMKLEDTFRALNKLVKDGKVKYLGVSNFKLKLLKESQALSETPIITNQVPYSLHDRSYFKNGVLEYCQENDILVTAYSPLGEGRLNVVPVLRSVAETHGKASYQIALAWLVQQPRVITIPMSFNAGHQKENIEAVDITLSKTEMEDLRQMI